MSRSNPNRTVKIHSEDGKWNSLYTIGAVAALISAVIIPISIVAFFVWPPFPDDLFAVIQNDRLGGLMSLDLLYLLSNVFAIPFFLVLYVTLKEVDDGWALLALALGLLALVCLFISRPILEVIALSDQHAAATTDAQRAMYQAAGEATLALFHGTAFNAHYILGPISLMISSFLMLRSEVFGKRTAYVGIVTNIVVFGLYVPAIGVYLSLLSVAGYLAWYILIARKLLHLRRNDGRVAAPVAGAAVLGHNQS
jgi:hypothetical protein